MNKETPDPNYAKPMLYDFFLYVVLFSGGRTSAFLANVPWLAKVGISKPKHRLKTQQTKYKPNIKLNNKPNYCITFVASSYNIYNYDKFIYFRSKKRI